MTLSYIVGGMIAGGLFVVMILAAVFLALGMVLPLFTSQIKEIASQGVQVAIVIGGGNIFRGLSGASKGFDRVKGDQMGMLATVINSLALSSALETEGQPAQVFTAINMFPIGEHYSKWKAIDAMKAGKVAVRPLLQFYFVMNSDKTTAIDKVLIIGSIFYIISPMNIMPVSIYKFLGVIDEGAALMYVYHKIKDLITPAINLKVDEVLEIWFGPEYTVL